MIKKELLRVQKILIEPFARPAIKKMRGETKIY